MRRTRLFTVVLGALVAVVLAPLSAAPGAAAEPLPAHPDGAKPTEVSIAALPTCTSWSSYWDDYYTNLVHHVPTAGRNSGRYDCTLRQGNVSDAVKVLQRALRHCGGYTNVAIDGEYGPVTRAAVLDLQRDVNDFVGWEMLAEDGIYGPETRDWLPFPLWTYPDNTMTSLCAVF